MSEESKDEKVRLSVEDVIALEVHFKTHDTATIRYMCSGGYVKDREISKDVFFGMLEHEKIKRKMDELCTKILTKTENESLKALIHIREAVEVIGRADLEQCESLGVVTEDTPEVPRITNVVKSPIKEK